MGNSSITLQAIVDDAMSSADLAPALATGGYSDAPAKSIANDVMAAICAGGPDGQPFEWKWNRLKVTPFTTNPYQQDYVVPGLLNLSWIEHAYGTEINSTAYPKRKVRMEARRDLEESSITLGIPSKVCWLPNSQLEFGIWGQAQSANVNGLANPGPGVVYTNPVGATQPPQNPVTQIKDSNGNLWVMTTFGTCGGTEPTWPATPTIPTYSVPTATATTQADGSCVWTAINPAGQGFRLDPVPASAGTVWQVNVVAQAKPMVFTALSQTLDPLPDDHALWFKQGFYAQCIRRNPDAKVRAKFAQEWGLWLKALDNAVKAGDREEDDMGFYPESSIMDDRFSYGSFGPNYPWGR